MSEQDMPDETFRKKGPERDQLVRMTSEIVAAYVSNNSVSIASVSDMIAQVHGALVTLGEPRGQAHSTQSDDRRPAIPVKRSVQPDFIVCLEDGKKFKSLKRYLRTQYSLTPEQYRSRWRLPHDYPMVAPNYAKARSDLAKNMGLGRKAPSVRRGRG